MEAIFIHNLKQPCKNRGVNFKDPKDGSVILDGNRYETMTDAEDYLLTKERKDLIKSCSNCCREEGCEMCFYCFDNSQHKFNQ